MFEGLTFCDQCSVVDSILEVSVFAIFLSGQSVTGDKFSCHQHLNS